MTLFDSIGQQVRAKGKTGVSKQMPGEIGSTVFPYVRRISVKGLFGRYTYELQLHSADKVDKSKLLILYGDNGSGKTTLLEMLFHLLNPARGGGHRSFIAKRIFRRFAVELGDGTEIIAERDAETLVGDFRMVIRFPDAPEHIIDWVLGEDGNVKGTEQGEIKEREFINYLAGLNLGLYLLSDNRRISATRHFEGFEAVPADFVAFDAAAIRHMQRSSHLRRTVQRLESKSTEAALELTVWRASNWATQQVLKATNKGDEDANAIFTKIIRRIVSHENKAEKRSSPQSKHVLIHDLTALSQRSLAFSRYGLIAPTTIDPLIKAIQSARASTLPTIRDVVKPYIDGLTVRMNALQKVHDSIDAFITNVNSFLHDKNVSFHMGSGLTIATPEAQSLPPGALSSGERQLLLLFTNLFVATRQNSLFIVDEPELSLNVKWQRRLIKQLLDFTKESRIQFVFATHSIELLTRYKEFVVQLDQKAKKLPA
jgi:energy-coupling factor transporter ATP-binding protein EcfA2